MTTGSMANISITFGIAIDVLSVTILYFFVIYPSVFKNNE